MDRRRAAAKMQVAIDVLVDMGFIGVIFMILRSIMVMNMAMMFLAAGLPYDSSFARTAAAHVAHLAQPPNKFASPDPLNLP